MLLNSYSSLHIIGKEEILSFQCCVIKEYIPLLSNFLRGNHKSYWCCLILGVLLVLHSWTSVSVEPWVPTVHSLWKDSKPYFHICLSSTLKLQRGSTSYYVRLPESRLSMFVKIILKFRYNLFRGSVKMEKVENSVSLTTCV